MKIFKLKNPQKFFKVFAALALMNIFFYLFFSSNDEKIIPSTLVEIVLQAKSFTPINPQKEVLIYDPERKMMVGSGIVINDESPGEEIKKIQLSLSSSVAQAIISKIETTVFHLYPKIDDLKIYAIKNNSKKDARYEIIF